MRSTSPHAMALRRTSGSDPSFRELTGLLDEELWARYPNVQQNDEPGNVVDEAVRVVVAFDGPSPVGCGCLRDFEEPGVVEMKRVYVVKEHRARYVAQRIVEELEAWARELRVEAICLETGVAQPEAVSLYEKLGYQRIANYGEYVGMKESICMRKRLNVPPRSASPA